MAARNRARCRTVFLAELTVEIGKIIEAAVESDGGDAFRRLFPPRRQPGMRQFQPATEQPVARRFAERPEMPLQHALGHIEAGGEFARTEAGVRPVPVDHRQSARQQGLGRRSDAGNPAGGKLPAGALQVRTDFGKPGYGGPCPPAGDHPHRYLFTVHAVSMDTLPVSADTSAAVVGFYLNFNTLAKAVLMALYRR